MTRSETDKNQQGANTSGGQGGSTSKETETLTKEQAEAMVSKARSDALAEVGRYKKAAETAVESMKQIEERLSRAEQERFEAELEAVKDEPDKLRDIQRRQRDAKDRLQSESDKRKWDAEKATYDERIKRAEAIERRDLAREVAQELGVDFKLLEKYGTDRDSMVELAKGLPKTGSGQGGQEGQGNRQTEQPEGGKTKGTTGQGRKPSLEELRASNPFETDKKVKSGEWVL